MKVAYTPEAAISAAETRLRSKPRSLTSWLASAMNSLVAWLWASICLCCFDMGVLEIAGDCRLGRQLAGRGARISCCPDRAACSGEVYGQPGVGVDDVPV